MDNQGPRFIHPTGTLTYLRDAPPAHYKIKIDNFSVLVSEKIEKYESAIFEAAGYKWRLTMCLDGSKDGRGKGHVSLYLSIADTKHFAVGWEANVNFRMFAYDHFQDKYLSIEDGRVRRLHDMKTKCGFRQLVSLDDFEDESNGYLVDDSCIFGVEIFVVKYAGKGETVSMLKNPKKNTFTWKIEKFSSLGEEELCSDEFTVGGYKWKLQCYPKGTSLDKDFSLFLALADSESLPPGWKLYVRFNLHLKSQAGTSIHEHNVTNWFCESAQNWGFCSFLPLRDLVNVGKGFIANDTIIVECELTVISSISYFL